MMEEAYPKSQKDAILLASDLSGLERDLQGFGTSPHSERLHFRLEDRQRAVLSAAQ